MMGIVTQSLARQTDGRTLDAQLPFLLSQTDVYKPQHYFSSVTQTNVHMPQLYNTVLDVVITNEDLL